MMLGGFEWLMMIFVIGLPILLVLLALGVIGVVLFSRMQTGGTAQNLTTANPPTVVSSPAGAAPSRYCAHCGAGLQADWSHCPQCGAPVGS